jgi:hypothetical protein
MYLNKSLPALLSVAALFVFALNVLSASDSDLEGEVAELMKRDSNQHRSSLTYNSILAGVARQRAYDMGKRNYFGHVNPDGIGANYLITQAGYALPSFYGNLKSSNNVESIAAGSETSAEVWQSWMHSSGHRAHILGLDDFYAAQIDYGIGHAFVPGSQYGHYWVIITARQEKRNTLLENGGATIEPDSNGECQGAATIYPHVRKASDGNLRPVCGYLWINDNDPDDHRVKPMPGLVQTGNGTLRPADGYTWVNCSDPDDYRVKPIQN